MQDQQFTRISKIRLAVNDENNPNSIQIHNKFKRQPDYQAKF